MKENSLIIIEIYPKSIYNVIDCVNSVVMDDKDAIILDFLDIKEPPH